MKALVLAAFALGATLPVVALGASAQPRSAQLSPTERARCIARHGRVMIAGLSGRQMCALPFRDGGRRCTSGSQCAGDCMFEGDQPRRADARVTGTCERYQYPYSCRTTIENGRIANSICID